MRARRALAALLLALRRRSPPAARSRARNKALHALFEREFQRALDEYPERGTHPRHRRLRRPPHRPVAGGRRAPQGAHRSASIAELKRFDPAKLSTQDRISRDVMLDNLRLAAEENALYGDLPFGADDSLACRVSLDAAARSSTLAYLVKATRFRTARDYENYLKRLDAVPRASSSSISPPCAPACESGWMPPREAMAARAGACSPSSRAPT